MLTDLSEALSNGLVTLGADTPSTQCVLLDRVSQICWLLENVPEAYAPPSSVIPVALAPPPPPPPLPEPAVTRTLSSAGPKRLLAPSRLSNSNVVLELLAVKVHVLVVHPMLVALWPVISKEKLADWPAA